MARSLRVVIAGGGTGGHLFPGIALAEELSRRGGEVLFVGTARGIEARIVPESPWELATLEVVGIKGKGMLGVVGGLLRLPQAGLQSLKIIRRFKPDLVVGVGGYASGPLVASAALIGIPTVILEQNSVPGLTNRILARLVKKIFATFPDPQHYFPAKKFVQRGNPIRADLLRQLQSGESERTGSGPRIFVFGGSQGARALNQMLLDALPELHEKFPNLEVLHQTGAKDLDWVQEGYVRAGLEGDRFRVMDFVRDMASAYRWCDLALCRAGATSLSELAAVGCPAILVPFPHAADNHQEYNARALVDAGAARMLLESECSAQELGRELHALLADKQARETMHHAMLRSSRPHAAVDICDEMERLVD